MSENREKKLKKLKIFGELFGTPSTLMDLVDAGKPQRRQRPSGMSARGMLREFRTREPDANPEFDIVGTQVPDIGKQARSETLRQLTDEEPKKVEPRLKRMAVDLQDLTRTRIPASKGTFVTVKTKLGRTKKTRIT
jgi:hypothetical protein